MEKYYLGIDTSNYTTSLCITDGQNIISEERQILDVKKGESGLRQSDALFHHTRNLPILCSKLFSNSSIDRSKISAVGVSSVPRDAKDSYMPCFLAGVSFATAFSSALDIPLYTFSHQAGHIVAAAVSGNCEKILENNFISFHVSGGTTEVLHVNPCDGNLSCEIIGGTLDLNAGQAIDRCGVMLGLSFPCGKEMDILSQASPSHFNPKVSVKGTYCNLSGLENICKEMNNKAYSAEDISKFVFSYIASTLKKITENCRRTYSDIPVLYAGGVMSNTYIRNELSGLSNVHFALPRYSCDNAFGISMLAYYKHNSLLNYKR